MKRRTRVKTREPRLVALVVGARPNFIKCAPLWWEFQKHPRLFKTIIIHTGQHYDETMSKVFFEELNLPEPHLSLGVGGGTHAQQTAKVMVRLERALKKVRPELIVVFGDVNSTVAAALVAAKAGIKIAHVEAGLRSFDKTMPEEINRIVTDRLSDYLFTTEPSANENLVREGVPPEKVFFVGNVMIDTLRHLEKRAASSSVMERFGLHPKGYALITLHRPSNVDEPQKLSQIFAALEVIARRIPVLFPAHPRTRERLDSLRLRSGQALPIPSGMRVIEPQGYLDFLQLQKNAKLVMTDSGGVQEETTALGVPCLTLRENTERPITLELGTNRLVGTDTQRIVAEGLRLLSDNLPPRKHLPPLWDGKAARRIVRIISQNLLCCEHADIR